MKTIAQRLEGRNRSVLLEASYTTQKVVHYHLKLDCGKLKKKKKYNINLKATSKIINKPQQLLKQIYEKHSIYLK